MAQRRPRARSHRQAFYRDLAESLLADDNESGPANSAYTAPDDGEKSAWSLQRFVNAPPAARRRRVVTFFESGAFQRFFVLFTLADVVALSVELLFPDQAITHWVAHVVTRSLLAIFVAEVVGLAYGLGLAFLRKPWCVCDAAVCLCSTLLEWHPWSSVELGVTLLPMRIWRFVRVIHAFSIAIELERAEQTRLERLVGCLAQARQERTALLDELQHEKRRVAALEEELARINSSARSLM